MIDMVEKEEGNNSGGIRYRCKRCGHIFDGNAYTFLCPECGNSDVVEYNEQLPFKDPGPKPPLPPDTPKWEVIKEWCRKHKKLFLRLFVAFLAVVAGIMVISVFVLLLGKDDGKSGGGSEEFPSDEPEIIDTALVNVSVNGDMIIFKITPEDKGYEIWCSNGDAEEVLSDNSYDTKKLKEGECCKFSLRRDKSPYGYVKWIKEDSMYEYDYEYCKEPSYFPPEILCESKEENGKYKITVNVTKGTADTYFLQKNNGSDYVVEQSNGVFENLEEGATYRVWAKNGDAECEPKNVTIPNRETNITVKNIQMALDKPNMKISDIQRQYLGGKKASDIRVSPSVDGCTDLQALITYLSFNDKIKCKCESVEEKDGKISLRIKKQ